MGHQQLRYDHNSDAMNCVNFMIFVIEHPLRA